MESGGVVQLRCKSGPRVVPPPTKLDAQPARKQEMQHDPVVQSSCFDEQYSDRGYPTLPRPKAILSLSRANLPWSSQQASMLGTLPVRVRRSSRKSESKLSCVVQCAPTLPAEQSLKTNTLPHPKQYRKRKSLSGIADLFRDRSCSSPAGVSRPSNLITREPASSVVVDQMSNHSRAQARREARGSAEGGDQEESQLKSKKSRKPSKSLTFSFGSGSDRKRKTLGFLGKGEKKNRKPSPIPPIPAPVTPHSPILVSRKAKTLPGSATLADYGRHYREVPVHPKFNSSLPVRYGSYQDVTGTRSPSRGKHRPPPLRNLSGSVGQHLCHTTTDTESVSPMTDYSPGLTSMSGMSSRPDSMESLPVSAVSETSHASSLARTATPPVPHRESPRATKTTPLTGYKSPSQSRRKLSDPMLSGGPGIISKSPQPHPRPGRAIKKRNTFCVRPSRVNPNMEEESQEMRRHVVRFLVETEQSYVESLRTILKMYYDPLRRPQSSALVDPALVKEIFHQIPEICSVHEHFLQQLSERVEHWDTERKIGDIFVNTFSKCHLKDIYKKFIGNFMRAKTSMEIAKQSKSVFAKFLEQRARDSHGKLTLDDLLIKPVQRIPRYVLFVKDLLKHTSQSHPDHTPLQQALGELTLLAARVNESERERERVGRHQELLGAVDGLAQLLSPDSRFISHNMVTEVKGSTHKRDRFLILFSDVLVCAATKRKSTSFKRSSMLNLNSVLSEGLKYNIKWHLPLTKTSVAQIQAPLFDSRKQNTVEKMIENLQKDEAILQEMLEKSLHLHAPHQNLVVALKELQTEVRESVASKKVELDNLPVESGRVDLISYASSPPMQYTIIFPSQKIRNQWKTEFLQVKQTADNQAPPSSSVAPPTSPLPVVLASDSEEVEFQGHTPLPSVRTGMKLTCMAEGLSVGGSSPSTVSLSSSPSQVPAPCVWACSSDELGGQVTLITLPPSAPPQILANITVSDTPITCIAASQAPPTTAKTTPPQKLTLLPNISVNSFSSSSSSDHVTISPTSSFDKDDDLIFIDGELELSTNSMTTPMTTPSKSQLTDSLTIGEFSRVRSNSAPPIPPMDAGGLDHHRVPSPATGQQSLSAQSSINSSEGGASSARKVWSALTLRPAMGEEGVAGCQGDCMWLGTEGGQLHVYRVGDNLRCRTQRRTLDLGAAVTCLRHCDGSVYAGLADGTLVVLDAQDPSPSPRHSIVVGSRPVKGCVSVMGQLWVACEGTVFCLDQPSWTLKAVCTLPSGQLIESVHLTGINTVWVTVQRSPLLHLLHAPSGSLLSTVDCRPPVLHTLRTRDPSSRRHSTEGVCLTSLQSSPSHLLVGTNTGMILTVPLPYIEPSLEPHPLLHPPTPTSLHYGHSDAVQFVSVVQPVQREGAPLAITGGSGHKCFSMATAQDAPDTANYVLVWKVKQQH